MKTKLHIEKRHWGTNVEVMLVGDLGVIDRFYTSAMLWQVPTDARPMIARDVFYVLEDQLASPVIGGSLADLHTYWRERKARRESRSPAVSQ